VERSNREQAVRAIPGIQDSVDQLGEAILALIKRGFWEEPRRRRAEELADRLVAACTRARLGRVARAARALQSLMKLSPEEAHSIEETLCHKLFELLGLVRVLTDADSAAGASGPGSPTPPLSSRDRSRSLRAGS
jgi:hypothetical protein